MNVKERRMTGIIKGRIWWSNGRKTLMLMCWCTRDYFLSLQILELKALARNTKYKALYQSRLKQAGS